MSLLFSDVIFVNQHNDDSKTNRMMTSKQPSSHRIGESNKKDMTMGYQEPSINNTDNSRERRMPKPRNGKQFAHPDMSSSEQVKKKSCQNAYSSTLDFTGP